MAENTVSFSKACPAKTDCKKAWDKVNEEVKKISNIEDPLERNNEINKAYANLFLENPDLHWAGAASIASKNVGCALESAKTAYDNSSQSFSTPFDIPTPLDIGRMIGSPIVFDRLGKGNKAIFEDMYSTHLFYAQNGKDPEILRQCAGSHPNNGIDKRVLEAFDDLNKGDVSSYMTKIMEPEQNLIQIPSMLDRLMQFEFSNMFDQLKFEKALDANRVAAEWNAIVGEMLEIEGAKPMEAYFSNGCEKPSDPLLTLKYEKDDFTNEEERKDYAQKGLDRFEQLYRERPDYIKKVINEIAKNGR